MTEAVQQNPDQRNSTDSPADNAEKDVATLAKEYGARLRHAVGYFEGVESRRQKTYRFKADDYEQTMHYGYGEIKLKFKSVKKSVSPLAEMTLQLWNGLERTMEVEVEYDRKKDHVTFLFEYLDELPPPKCDGTFKFLSPLYLNDRRFEAARFIGGGGVAKKKKGAIQHKMSEELLGAIVGAPEEKNEEDLAAHMARLSLDTSSELNKSQQEAIKLAVSQPLSLIQGPPGTGKTTVIVHLIKELLKEGEKILVVAPTNAAVDVAMLKLINLLDETGDKTRSFRVVGLNREDLVHVDLKDFMLEVPAQRQRQRWLKRKVIDRRNKEEKKRLDDSQVIFATCVAIGRHGLNWFSAGTVIIDEAVQAMEIDAIVAAIKAEQRLVLVGDDKQLSSEAPGELKTSLYERLLTYHKVTMLKVQYRMHSGVALYPNNQFYEGHLENGVKDSQRQMPKHLQWKGFNPKMPVIFWHMETTERGSGEDGKSFDNPDEAKAVARAVKFFLKADINPFRETRALTPEIVVVTPYAGQRTLIERELGTDAERIRIGTVNELQGAEGDIIIISTVRCNPKGALGFVADRRRLNVAITRAKRAVVLIGSYTTLTAKNADWLALVELLESKNCLVKGVDLHSIEAFYRYPPSSEESTSTLQVETNIEGTSSSSDSSPPGWEKV